MDITFTDVLITVIFLLILALPGFIIAKIKFFPEKAGETISTLVLYVCQSALVITSFQSKEYVAGLGVNLLLVAGLSALAHLAMFLLLRIIFISKSKDEKFRVVKYASVFSNCGFMGFPFLQSLFSGSALMPEIMLYGAGVIAVFNIMNWTFGVYIMTGEKKEISVKKILLNPVIISVIVGFLLFIILKKPIVDLAKDGSTLDKVLTKLMQSVNFFSDMVTPLSMTVIGIKLAGVDYKKLLLDGWAYVVSGLKLVLMPVIVLLLVAFLPIAGTIKYTLYFLLAMPSATSTAMFAVRFNKDGSFASVCVLLSTILSILTIPLLYLVISGVFGITV